MTTADAQRKAFLALCEHVLRRTCSADPRSCQVCFDLDRAASAESWRRSVAREQVAR